MRRYLSLIFAFLLICSASYGLSLSDLGTQITINDGQVNSTWGGGSQALGMAGEDNETEGNPNTYTFQGWDLEGMFWNSSTNKLFILGGFNYLSGGPDGHTNVNMGDIFIGDNHVLDLSRTGINKHLTATGTYDIVKDYTNVANPTDVFGSAPYAYSSGGTIQGSGTYSAYQISALDWANIDVFEPWRVVKNGEWTNDIHYALEINVTGIAIDLISSGSLIHATLKCGNDTIEGQMTPTPEPATMFLLGSGLVGLAFYRRKKIVN